MGGEDNASGGGETDATEAEGTEAGELETGALCAVVRVATAV
jgi:hypothetical protein